MHLIRDPCDPNAGENYSHYLVPMGPAGIIFGIVICIGSVVSVVPQVITIIVRRSTKGVSGLMLFFALGNQYAGMVNAYLLKFGQVMACFNVGFRCLPSLIPLLQLSGLFLNYYVLVIEYLIFRPIPKRDSSKYSKLGYLGGIVLFLALNAVMLTVVAIFTGVDYEFGPCRSVVSLTAYGFGLFSTACGIIQWAPQIWQTFRAKGSGSLSLLMLLIQCPGGYAITFFFGVISHENWTTFLPYLMGALQMNVLIVQIIWYDYVKKIIKHAMKKSPETTKEDQELLLDSPIVEL